MCIHMYIYIYIYIHTHIYISAPHLPTAPWARSVPEAEEKAVAIGCRQSITYIAYVFTH